MTLLDEYLDNSDPEKRERAANWSMAIGLQAVDGLKTSNYMVEIARQQIEGKITMDEVQELISAHYQAKKKQKSDADKAVETEKRL